MTYLNTINNLGGKWSQTLFLWLVDIISWKQCVENLHINNSTTTAPLSSNKCSSKEEKELCLKNGGRCQTDVDGYYIEFAMNVVYGIVFYAIGKRLIEYLEKLPIDDWHVLSKDTHKNDAQEEEMEPIANGIAEK
jgi:PAT family acetyl-CoA transporter-like MFS transporter 1